MRKLFILGVALMAGGCATVTRGTTDQITVTSEPSGARVTTSLQQSCISPCTFTVALKDEFIVSIAADGYKTQEVPVKTEIAGRGAAGFAGNLLLGGPIGMGVDAATGSTLEHVPNPVNVTLEKLGPAPKVTASKKPKSSKTKIVPATEEVQPPNT